MVSITRARNLGYYLPAIIVTLMMLSLLNLTGCPQGLIDNGAPDSGNNSDGGVDNGQSGTSDGSPTDRDVPFQRLAVDTNGPPQNDDKGMHIKTMGDINGDGYMDGVVASALPGSQLIWYDGRNNWEKHIISSLGGWSTDAAVGDVDNDGDQDIVISVWYREHQGIEWFENVDRGKSWVPHYVGWPYAHDVELADLDLDGRLDIITRRQHAEGTTIELWKQETPTSWLHRTLSGAIPQGEGLAVADMDGDGDADIVISGTWFENTRDILNGDWPAHVYTTVYKWPQC